MLNNFTGTKKLNNKTINFSSTFAIQSIKIQNGGKMKYFLICYLALLTYWAKIGKFQPFIKEKLTVISIQTDVTLYRKKNFVVIQSCKQELLRRFFQFPIFGGKCDIFNTQNLLRERSEIIRGGERVANSKILQD